MINYKQMDEKQDSVLGSMSDYQWLSCYRLTDDLTEVQLFEKVSL